MMQQIVNHNEMATFPHLEYVARPRPLISSVKNGITGKGGYLSNIGIDQRSKIDDVIIANYRRQGPSQQQQQPLLDPVDDDERVEQVRESR